MSCPIYKREASALTDLKKGPATSLELLVDYRKDTSFLRKGHGLLRLMTCTCGDTMKVESATREQAVSQLKTMMNESKLSAHMKEKHPGQQAIHVSQVHAAIEQTLIAV